jgi:hypothetical protein
MKTMIRPFVILAAVCPFIPGLARPAYAAEPAPVARPAYRGLLLEMTGDEKRPVNVWDASGTPVLDPFYEFAKKGVALVDREYALRLEGGCFFSAGAEEYLGAGLKGAAGELTLSAYVQPATASQAGAGCIIGYGSASNLLFALRQEKDALIFQIGATASEKIGPSPLKSAAPFHLAVTVGAKEIVFFLDGAKVGTRLGVAVDFSKVADGRLYFGNDGSGTHPWRGMLERVTLHNYMLAPKAVKDAADAILEEIGKRDRPPRIEIEATLLSRSEYPQPWDKGFTYREVLSVCEYKVNKVIRGEYKPERIRVAEWMYVDRIFLTNSQQAIGAQHRLEVEPLDANPQLSTTHRADALDLDMDAVVYYDRSPLEALPESRQPKPKTEK